MTRLRAYWRSIKSARATFAKWYYRLSLAAAILVFAIVIGLYWKDLQADLVFLFGTWGVPFFLGMAALGFVHSFMCAWKYSPIIRGKRDEQV